jgi:hypothetical protein
VLEGAAGSSLGFRGEGALLFENVDLCIVHTRAAERISPLLAAELDRINPATLHEYVLVADIPVELYYRARLKHIVKRPVVIPAGVDFIADTLVANISREPDAPVWIDVHRRGMDHVGAVHRNRAYGTPADQCMCLAYATGVGTGHLTVVRVYLNCRQHKSAVRFCNGS